MSNRKSAGFSLARQNTISRRAWIEKALAGTDLSAPADADQPETRDKSHDKPGRPHLYLVVSN